MFQTKTRKTVLLIGWSGALLLVSLAVVFRMNVYFDFAADPWNIAEIGLLWCFLTGCMCVPRAVRHARTGESHGARSMAWYRRPVFVFCLLGGVSGLLCLLSFIQKWILSSNRLPSHNPGLEIAPPYTVIGLDPFLSLIVSNGHINAMMIPAALINLCWFMLVLILGVHVFKQKNRSIHE